MAEWRWYISIAAIRDYFQIANLTGDLEDDNPAFCEAQEVLGGLSLTAKLARTPPSRSGSLTYRGKITLDGRRRRIECDVVPTPREEGSLPQLVRVRLK